MTISAWRIVSRRYAEAPYNPFDGEGSSLRGGRWNSPGVAVVYASASRSLAILEVLVHTGDLAGLRDFVAFEVAIPPASVEPVGPGVLPPDWTNPVAPAALRAAGDAWVAALSSPVLRVPSAVVDGEDNFVLNPRHPDFRRLTIGPRRPLPIDPRLLPKA
ncbi:MAG: RES family NAD+ phosphorylase [Gemmataceae bacterium]|nr:RES family NAD+ phosphorylase [Gemmataceae bacterium]